MERPESYENEPKESIDMCLNCDLPEYLCYGKGHCKQRIAERQTTKRLHGQLEMEIAELVHAGINRHEIQRRVGVKKDTFRHTVIRMEEKGMITKEERMRLVKLRTDCIDTEGSVK